MGEIGESFVDFLVQHALGDLPMGKANRQIASGQGSRCLRLTSYNLERHHAARLAAGTVSYGLLESRCLRQLPVGYSGNLVKVGVQGDDFQIVGLGQLSQQQIGHGDRYPSGSQFSG